MSETLYLRISTQNIQWRNQIWQSLEEGAGKRCSECEFACERERERERESSQLDFSALSTTQGHLRVKEEGGRWMGGGGALRLK